MSFIKNSILEISKPTASTWEICHSLQILMDKMKVQPTVAAEVLECLYNPSSTNFLQRLSTTDNEELILLAVQCFEETVNNLSDDLTPTQLKILEAMGSTLLHFHYASNKQFGTITNLTLFLIITLSLLVKITSLCPNFVQVNLSELLGIAKINVRFRLDTEKVMLPEKILPSENLPYDSSTEELEYMENDAGARRSGGGKVSKKRKPRALAKSMQSNHHNQQQQSSHQQACIQILTLEQIFKDITSDSDTSELENNQSEGRFSRVNTAQDRQRFSRIRFLAITLLGTLTTRVQDRRIIYSYWHAFFENTKIPASSETHKIRSDLLYIGLHDPNTRCRATALQIAGQLIFTSKNLLQQAECVVERLPTAFLPFAHRLGLQVVSMFEELTQILETESSLPVLTQALKCLAVLVQATTPFHRFKPRDFISDFVRQIHRLVSHRDATIQVAALMVLEFLISTSELTPEVTLAIGAVYKRYTGTKEQHLCNERTENFLEIDSNIDEHIESESEEDVSFPTGDKTISSIDNHTKPQKLECWLLQRVLRNLGTLSQNADRNTATSPASVRVESLQLLAAISQHFWLLESQLKHVAIALQNTMSETLPDLRICGARCLDTIAYQIGRTLVENTTKENAAPTEKHRNQLEEQCLIFWAEILPTIMTQIRSPTPDGSSVFKVCLCDSLSNIGVVIFERQTYATQMNLIGSLSSIACDSNEDVNVRCASVRALAVYALFPSLRGNLVFVENAAELTLRLFGEKNVTVRVKASWSLGNISDALLVNMNNTTDPNTFPERISDELLWRLISASTEACNDNDKVRCNAVRTLGNLLRLLDPANFKTQTNGVNSNRYLFNNAILKLIDCLRASSSAKVKWNTCYSIGNLLQNNALFNQTLNDCDWQSKLFSTLTNIIVNHQNFKVRINAATALTRTTRSQLGAHFEMVWKALLDAIEQSHHLENFYEYNHRDQLQEQLCLALSHILHCAQSEDFCVLHKHLEDERSVMLRNTWTRVVNRMVPEKSAPILACSAFLQQELKDPNANFTMEQKNAINSISRIVEIQ